jgi:hypothetical protein
MGSGFLSQTASRFAALLTAISCGWRFAHKQTSGVAVASGGFEVVDPECGCELSDGQALSFTSEFVPTMLKVSEEFLKELSCKHAAIRKSFDAVVG